MRFPFEPANDREPVGQTRTGGTASEPVHKKRQSRRTRGFIGLGSTSICGSSRRSQERVSAEKRARCDLPSGSRPGSGTLARAVAKKVRTPSASQTGPGAAEARHSPRRGGRQHARPWLYAGVAAIVAAVIAAAIGIVVGVRGGGRQHRDQDDGDGLQHAAGRSGRRRRPGRPSTAISPTAWPRSA